MVYKAHMRHMLETFARLWKIKRGLLETKNDSSEHVSHVLRSAKYTLHLLVVVWIEIISYIKNPNYSFSHIR